MKNYIVIADVCSSVKLLYWREEDSTLTLLSQDYNETICRSISFMADGPKLGIVIADDEANIQVLQYNPK